MRARTEELLYVLLWAAESFARPTWHSLTTSFDEWAWQRGLGPRLAELERQKLLELRPGSGLERVVRLTREGVRLALGGRDPSVQWSRRWDGRWRMVLFDLPIDQRKLRQKLWRMLRSHHFGYLQDSVWVSPDSAEAMRIELRGTRVRPDAFLIIEGRPAAGESDAEIVDGAWNFSRINRGYEHYLRFARGPRPSRSGLRGWSQEEARLWRDAVQQDPLLPVALLPADYLGREALVQRQRLLGGLSATLLPA